MKYLLSLALILSLMSFGNNAEAKVPNSKAVHKEMHDRLLANASTGIDRQAVQDYIKAEIEIREAVESEYEGLSIESVAMIKDLLAEAKTHTGKRYRYGGKGPDGFDCSGFTGYVYNQFGYKLDASSRGQYSEGVAVESGNLRPGDLVFFKGRSVKGGVGHVGIVVTADNEKHTFSFIHAAIGGGIEIQKSTAPYYQQRYVGARRIITE